MKKLNININSKYEFRLKYSAQILYYSTVDGNPSHFLKDGAILKWLYKQTCKINYFYLNVIL